MKLKFFLITIVVICLILSITGTTTELYQMAKPTSLIYKNNPVVILDAGHGGVDGGAVADDGTVEKDLNLQIAKKVEKFIKAFGFATVMTRNDDASTDSNEGDKIRIRKKNDMHNRLNTMKQYENAVFVSIHLNKFSQEDCHGAQVIYSPRTADSSKLLAEKNKNTGSLLALEEDWKKVLPDLFVDQGFYIFPCYYQRYEVGDRNIEQSVSNYRTMFDRLKMIFTGNEFTLQELFDNMEILQAARMATLESGGITRATQ